MKGSLNMAGGQLTGSSPERSSRNPPGVGRRPSGLRLGRQTGTTGRPPQTSSANVRSTGRCSHGRCCYRASRARRSTPSSSSLACRRNCRGRRSSACGAASATSIAPRSSTPSRPHHRPRHGNARDAAPAVGPRLSRVARPTPVRLRPRPGLDRRSWPQGYGPARGRGGGACVPEDRAGHLRCDSRPPRAAVPRSQHPGARIRAAPDAAARPGARGGRHVGLSGRRRFRARRYLAEGASTCDRAAPDPLVRRYLAAFGPASVADAQAWSGLPKLAPVFEATAPELVTFRDARQRELFDLPRRPDPKKTRRRHSASCPTGTTCCSATRTEAGSSPTSTAPASAPATCRSPPVSWWTASSPVRGRSRGKARPPR